MTFVYRDELKLNKPTLTNRIQYFRKCMFAKTRIILKTRFFEKKTLVWNIILPFFWGLQFYFQYLPFGNPKIIDKFFNSTVSIPILEYTFSGQLVWLLFINASLLGGIFFLYERYEGTLETLMLSPAPRVAIMFGSSIAGVINFVWFIVFSMIVALVLDVDFQISNYWGIFVMILLVILAMLSLGLLFQTIFLGTRLGGTLATAIQEPMIFTSGLAFPVEKLPRMLIYLSLSFPLSYSLFIVRGMLFSGLTLIDVKASIVGLGIIILVLFSLSLKMIRLIEAKMKNEASMTLF